MFLPARISLLVFGFLYSLSSFSGTIEPIVKKNRYTPIQPINVLPPLPQEEKPKNYVRAGTDVVTLTLSGHVNRAMTYVDNGVKRRLIHVDNDNSSSRIRAVGRAKVTDSFTIGANFEFEMQSNDSSETDITDSGSPATPRQRKTEALFESKYLGTFYIGHGPTRSDTTSENDLSKTDNVALGCTADAMTGGLRFREKDRHGYLGIGPSVGDVYSSMDGLSRKDRFRWDSPDFYGFSIGASHIMQNSNDFGINYSGKIYGTQIQSSIAYAKNRKVFEQFNTSTSILFENGFNIGGGTGVRSLVKPFRHHPRFYHGKVGYIMKLFSIGDTAIAFDHGIAKHIDEDRDISYLTGGFLVQEIDKAATQIYFGVRHHKLKRTDIRYKPIMAVVLGAIVKF